MLVLDEPLNGLDPLVRAEIIALFRSLAEEGMHIIISSHMLHEVDMISDQVVLLSNGYVVAEGKIRGVRSECDEQPMQILIRCNAPAIAGGEGVRTGQRGRSADPRGRQGPAGQDPRSRQVLSAC